MGWVLLSLTCTLNAFRRINPLAKEAMSSREHQLLSRIIRSGQLDEVLSWGITQSDFVTSEARAMFVNLVNYHELYRNSVLGPEAAKQAYPTFQLCDDPNMHLVALCQEVRNNRLAIEGQNRVKDIQQMLTHDPIQAVQMMSAAAADMEQLTGSNNTDVRVGDAFARILHNYDLKRQGYDFSRCPWPWQLIQAETNGIQPNDYIVFYGRPKSMKSWVLAYLISWCFNQNKRLVIYTKEMGADDIFTRVLACLAAIDASHLRKGTMELHEDFAVRSVVRMVEMAKASGQMICLSGQDCADGNDTVPWLRSKLKKYKPDMCFIDGLYLMSDVKRAKKDHERVKNISQALRQVTLNDKLPIIATLQANRKAAGHSEGNLDEIAFSDSIGQDATHIFRVINEKNSPTCAIVTAGGREFNLSGWRIYGIPATNFSEYGELTDKEIEGAKEKDVGDGDTSQPNKPRPPASPAMRRPDTAAQTTSKVANYAAQAMT